MFAMRMALRRPQRMRPMAMASRAAGRTPMMAASLPMVNFMTIVSNDRMFRSLSTVQPMQRSFASARQEHAEFVEQVKVALSLIKDESGKPITQSELIESI